MCLTFVVLVHSLIYLKKKVYTEFQGVMTVVIFDPLHGKSRKEFTECLFFPHNTELVCIHLQYTATTLSKSKLGFTLSLQQ